MTIPARNSSNGYCPTCGLWWTGKLDCHCVRCHRHFTSEGAFDSHLRLMRGGQVMCLDPQFVRSLKESSRAGIIAWSRDGEPPYDLLMKARVALEGDKPREYQ